MVRWTVLGLLGLLTSGCATAFVGSAKVEGGRYACERKCKEQGMQLAGMVFMGEYSDACVCQVRGTPAMTPVAMASATAGGASGVYMQMMRQRQQRQ